MFGVRQWVANLIEKVHLWSRLFLDMALFALFSWGYVSLSETKFIILKCGQQIRNFVTYFFKVGEKKISMKHTISNILWDFKNGGWVSTIDFQFIKFSHQIEIYSLWSKNTSWLQCHAHGALLSIDPWPTYTIDTA